MSKQLFILLGVLSIQICASLEVDNSNQEERATEKILKLDAIPYGVAEEINSGKDAIAETPRQKRFFDYIGYTGSSAFSSVYPSAQTYPTSDSPYSTVIPNEQKRLSNIVRLLKDLADITRPQYSPSNHHNIQLPIYLPFNFIPQLECTCNPFKPKAPAQTTTRPAATYLPPTTAPDKQETEATPVPDFLNRSEFNKTNDDVSDDYEDGVRPISFDPITPKVPLSVDVPPVEHGSYQAGLDPPPAPSAGQAAPGNKLEAARPSVCEGAILTCCHKPQVTAECFVREGCTGLNLENPCDVRILSTIVSRFREYFKQRG